MRPSHFFMSDPSCGSRVGGHHADWPHRYPTPPGPVSANRAAHVSVAAVYPGATAEELATGGRAAGTADQRHPEHDVHVIIYWRGPGSITVTFKAGTNIDIAQVDAQNRIQTVLPQLPQEVRDLGITVRKASTETLLIVQCSPPRHRGVLQCRPGARTPVANARRG
jgi:hypothetical protein